MKNVQVIDGADNAVYDVFAVSDADFGLIFPPGQDVAFLDEVRAREDSDVLDAAFERIWAHRVPKSQVMGIHGLLFVDLPGKKAYYPSRRDEEAVNPDGTRLR